MTRFEDMTRDEIAALKSELDEQYAAFKAKGLKLNMARGKPDTDQLNLSMPMLDVLTSDDVLLAENGIDARNYGLLDGIPEAKELMAILLDDEPANVIVGGNSSLNLMYDQIVRCWIFGPLGARPWSEYEKIRWICPVPGYDRHFAVTQAFGVEMIPVRMDENGPDMDEVERIVASDESVKGFWCVPKYSNPGGITFSDEVVRRLASMECAAEDFRIFWDNAYCVHHLYDEPENQDQLLDIGRACAEAGNPDRYYKFASTSKVSFPGAGVAALAASPANVADILSHMTIQTIGYDKINQMRHVRYFKDAEGIRAHMAKQAAILRPKFELVAKKLDEGLGELEIASWSNPRGGYFVSFDAPEGCAKRIVSLVKDAGVVMTGAGATWPLKNDPTDSNIRIAPTVPPLEELDAALDVFVCCVKLAACEKALAE